MSKIIKIITMFLVSITMTATWAAEDEVATDPVAIYYQFPAKPPLRIDFSRQSKQQASLLQVEVALMSYQQDILTLAENNLPMLQHGLRRLLAKQSLDSVNSVDGRKKLQMQALTTINSILKDETGKEGIEGIYFTSFIIQ